MEEKNPIAMCYGDYCRLGQNITLQYFLQCFRYEKKVFLWSKWISALKKLMRIGYGRKLNTKKLINMLGIRYFC